nr:ATP-binding protein [Ferrimicrobium acidiphilum]
MIKSLEVVGYRGFDRLEMSELGRINLLVGKNNSGKTSVLEALSLLSSGYDPSALLRIVTRRGEMVLQEVQQGQPLRQDIDISHLFHQHELRPDARFAIDARPENGSPNQKITYSIIEVQKEQVHPHYIAALGMAGNALVGPNMGLKLEIPEPHLSSSSIVPLAKRLLRPEDLQILNNIHQRQKTVGNCQFVSTDSLSSSELTAAWDDVSLTDQEQLVSEALRYLEPKIERIAATTAKVLYFYPQSGSRGGFKVRLRGVSEPVPIGSLGDGMWRMLALAIALIRAKDGLLLVDEIDTGLHYSVMADLWTLISRAAKEFNVQVFSTTHSYDCVHSLASICQATTDSENQVTIQRLEAGKPCAVAFSADEIVSAARNYIEVR